MNEEAELIVKAIESLRPENIWYKDYLFPVVSSFLSAILGAFVAYFTLQYQDKIKSEREKLNICNDWTLAIEGLFQSLIAFKGNYYEKMSRDPFQRALSISSIIGHSPPIDKNVAELSFLVPTKDDPSSQEVKWRSLSRINALISNYNLILQLWEKRNSIERDIREKLISTAGDKAYADLNHEQILDALGKRDVVGLIDLTEKAVHLTDDIIIESNSFLNDFTNTVKSLLNLKLINKYGRLIAFENQENAFLQKLVKKCPELDCSILVNLYGVPEEVIKSQYDNGY